MMINRLEMVLHIIRRNLWQINLYQQFLAAVWGEQS